MSAEIPENVRQVLKAVTRQAADAAGVENDNPHFVIGYQIGALEAVVDLVQSVLDHPTWSRSVHMQVHWAAADRRLADRAAEVAGPSDGVIRCEGGCGRTTTDPDLWDPDAVTERVFCDACWPTRNDVAVAR